MLRFQFGNELVEQDMSDDQDEDPDVITLSDDDLGFY